MKFPLPNLLPAVLTIIVTCTSVQGANYLWIGPTVSSPFAAASWLNTSNLQPTTFSAGIAVNSHLSASNVEFNLSTNQILSLGNGSLSLTDSILRPTGSLLSAIGITGDASDPPSLVNLAGSTVIATTLHNLNIEAGESATNVSQVYLIASRSAHNNGTVFNGSINLTGFSSFALAYIGASPFHTISAQEVIDAYLPKVFFEGNPAILGLDLFVAEPGDNLILTPVFGFNNSGDTFINGYNFVPIPEPSAVLLGFLSLSAFLRHRR